MVEKCKLIQLQVIKRGVNIFRYPQSYVAASMMLNQNQFHLDLKICDIRLHLNHMPNHSHLHPIFVQLDSIFPGNVFGKLQRAHL